MEYLEPLHYLYIYNGITIYYAESIEKISENIKEVQPNFMSVVPRLLEKIYDSIIAKGQYLTYVACDPRETVELCNCCGKVRATRDFPDDTKKLRQEKKLEQILCRHCRGQYRDDIQFAKCKMETCRFPGRPDKGWPQAAFTPDEWAQRKNADDRDQKIVCAAILDGDSNPPSSLRKYSMFLGHNAKFAPPTQSSSNK